MCRSLTTAVISLKDNSTSFSTKDADLQFIISEVVLRKRSPFFRIGNFAVGPEIGRYLFILVVNFGLNLLIDKRHRVQLKAA